MFSRSSKKKNQKVATVSKRATIQIVKPEQKEEPALDLERATIEMVEPTGGLMINVEKEEEED